MLSFLVAFALTIASTFAVQPLLRRLDMFDRPGSRSLHAAPVLRGGGLAVAIGVTSALLLTLEGWSWYAASLVIVPVGIGVIGWVDDRRSRSVHKRLAAQLIGAAVGGLFVAEGIDLEPMVLIPVFFAIILWIVGYVNVFNFMDGINGISSFTAVVAGAVYLILGTQLDSDLVVVAGAALAGGALGFLPFNYPTARLFLGDVGSYFLGAYIAVFAAVVLAEGAGVLAAVGPVVLYLADTSVTILRRWRRDETIWRPHRAHTYQRLARGRLGHSSTTVVVGALTALTGAIGLVAEDRGLGVAVACGLGLVAVAAAYLTLPETLARHSVEEVRT